MCKYENPKGFFDLSFPKGRMTGNIYGAFIRKIDVHRIPTSRAGMVDSVSIYKNDTKMNQNVPNGFLYDKHKN